MNKKLRKIYLIIGPTASGKTALSIKLAKELKNAEIISADSRQIYKDFNLSSGKITKDEMENIPHHMLDIIDPGMDFSVVDFTEMSLRIIKEIYSRGNIPIICGGTGFYIDNLLYKYDLPEVEKNVELRKKLVTMNVDELFEILKKLNKDEAAKIMHSDTAKNKHRLMRRIEVVEKLGYFPALKKSLRFDPNIYDVKIINTNVPLNILRQKINTRLIERIDQGMMEEIKNVKEKYNLSDKYLNGLGLEFKWVNKFLNSEISQDEMLERLNLEIGQYARRQIAWFKRYN